MSIRKGAHEKMNRYTTWWCLGPNCVRNTVGEAKSQSPPLPCFHAPCGVRTYTTRSKVDGAPAASPAAAAGAGSKIRRVMNAAGVMTVSKVRTGMMCRKPCAGFEEHLKRCAACTIKTHDGVGRVVC